MPRRPDDLDWLAGGRHTYRGFSVKPDLDHPGGVLVYRGAALVAVCGSDELAYKWIDAEHRRLAKEGEKT